MVEVQYSSKINFREAGCTHLPVIVLEKKASVKNVIISQLVQSTSAYITIKRLPAYPIDSNSYRIKFLLSNRIKYWRIDALLCHDILVFCMGIST
jgi:hypothetical protein